MDGDSDWSNILPDIGYVILCKLSDDFVDHLWFGAVCKNWYAIAKQYNQLTRPAFGTLPMYFVPVSECGTQRKLMINNMFNDPRIHHHVTTLSHIPNKRCCGSSYGWLAFIEEDISITLINPFKFKGVTIHLPVLKTEATDPYDLTISKLILTPDSTPDSYLVMAIHSGMRNLAIIRSGDTKWGYIVCKDVFTKRVTLSDIVYHKGLVYAIDHQCKIFSIDININSRHVEIRALNIRDLPLRNIDQEQYYHSYIVESTSGEDLYVLRRQMEYENNVYKTVLFRVLKLELNHDDETDCRFEVVESLNGDAIFVSEIYSTAVKSSNFNSCSPNSIYFIDDFICNLPEDMIEDSGIYNFEDKKITKLCLRDPNPRYRRNAFWVQPPFS